MKHNGDLVSVIIPTFNRKGMLIECIDSVLKSTYKNIEIIVSDDASFDGTREAVAKYKKLENFKYLRNKKESLLSVTINKAIFASSGEYIFILDDDNVIDKNCISSLVSSFAKFKDAGIVGPIAFYKSHPDIIMHAGTVRSKYLRRIITPYSRERFSKQLKEGTVVEDFANAFIFKREILKKIGMWDLLVPFQGEDGDFETRARKIGYKVILNPNAKVYHNRKYEESELWEGRINKMRMYHFMHSKILYVYRYDSTVQKIIFTLSIPIYICYYMKLILFNVARGETRSAAIISLIDGTFRGIIDSILNKNQIPKYKTKC